MKKIIFSMFLIALLCCRCRDNSSIVVEKSVHQDRQYEDSTLDVAIKRFGLSNGDQGKKEDDNRLVFYCLASFDSSFLIQFNQEQNEIRGGYFVELPRFYNVDDFAAQESYLMFFEGYSFAIDSTVWLDIKKKAEELLLDTSLKISPGCRGCAVYGLSYGAKKKVDNGAKLDSFFEYLKEKVLNEFTQKKTVTN